MEHDTIKIELNKEEVKTLLACLNSYRINYALNLMHERFPEPIKEDKRIDELDKLILKLYFLEN